MVSFRPALRIFFDRVPRSQSPKPWFCEVLYYDGSGEEPNRLAHGWGDERSEALGLAVDSCRERRHWLQRQRRLAELSGLPLRKGKGRFMPML